MKENFQTNETYIFYERFLLMKLHSRLISSIFIASIALTSHTGFSQSRSSTEPSELSGARSPRYKNDLRSAGIDVREIKRVLDLHKPRFWADLTRTGRTEAVENFVSEVRAEESDFDVAEVMATALRTARINDAIYARASVSAVVEILQPELSKDLGYGRGEPVESLEAVAISVLDNGDSRKGLYSSVARFNEAYESAVGEHRSGR